MPGAFTHTVIPPVSGDAFFLTPSLCWGAPDTPSQPGAAGRLGLPGRAFTKNERTWIGLHTRICCRHRYQPERRARILGALLKGLVERRTWRHRVSRSWRGSGWGETMGFQKYSGGI